MEKIRKPVLYAGVFLLFFMVYVYSMGPSYNSDDSPETALAQITLGIQHPPGYPLNTLAGKIITLLPLGGSSFKANLSAPFFGAMSCLMIFMLFLGLLKEFKTPGKTVLFAAFAGTVIYGLSASAWLQACFAKGGIYTMNSFFAAAFMYCVFRSPGSTRYSSLAGFVFGLSTGNHWTSMAVLAPAALIFIIFNIRRYKPAHALYAALFFAAGASVYLFVFIRSAGAPAYAWGDTKTIKDFLWLITRAQYSGIESKHTVDDTLRLLSHYASNFFTKEFFIISLFAAAAGIYHAFKTNMRTAAAMLAAYVFIIAGVVSLATPPPKTEWLIKTYLVSSNIFAAFFAAAGIAFAAGKAGKFGVHTAAVIAVAALAGTAAANYPSYERYFTGYDYSRNISKMIEGKNALLFIEGDMYIGAALFETIAEKRDYAAVIPVVLQYEWYREQLKRNFGSRLNLPPNNNDMRLYIESFIAANPDKEIYYSNVFTQDWVKNLSPKPEGLLIKILTRGGTVVVSDHYFRLYSFRGYYDDKTGQDDFTVRLVNENYAMAYFNFADKLREHGNLKAAAVYYDRGGFFKEEPSAFINSGLCSYYLGNYDAAYFKWTKAAELDASNPLPLINIAYIYIAKKDNAGALRYLEMALSRSPNNQNALALKKQLTQANGKF